jgi:hypothetical protein
VKARLRVRLEGRSAEVGEVSATDFARLLLGTQSAIQRAAGHVIGRRNRETGRPGKVIEDSTRLRLVAIEPGSIVAVLDPPRRPDDPHALELTDPALGALAIETALRSAMGGADAHPDVADALVRMADEVGLGRRYDAITLERERPNAVTRVRIDPAHRDALRAVARRPATARDDSLIGVLVEADFENLTARLRGPAGTKTTVSFSPELADDIYAALRASARLRGEVRYDAKTSEARSIRLIEIERGDQLTIGLEPGDFWLHPSLAELAEQAGIGPIADVRSLRDDEASDEDVDRLMAALESM